MPNSERITTIQNDIQAAHQALMETLTALPADTWQQTVQADADQWTVLQLARHLLDIHYFQRRQIEAFTTGQPTVDETFDIDQWNRAGQVRCQLLTADDVLDALTASHLRLITYLDNITGEQLDQTLWHFALRQTIPFEKYLNLLAFHERLHTQDIDDLPTT